MNPLALLPIAGFLAVALCAIATPAPAGDRGVVVVYDSSGSMRAQTSDRHGKREVAQAAFRYFTGGLSEQSPGSIVSVVSFGHSVAYVPSSGAARVAGCKDIDVVAPPVRLDAGQIDQMDRIVSGLPAKGYSPITETLAKTADVLGADGGIIVLISDFEDTCDQNPNAPCEALHAINLGRDKNRVEIDAIVVPRAGDMRTEAVDRLAACSGAKRIDLTRPEEAQKAMAELARRVAEKQRQASFAQPTLKVLGLDLGSGAVLRDGKLRVEIQRAGESSSVFATPIPMPTDPIALPSGTYEVSLWSGEEEIMRRNAVSLAPGEHKTVYFAALLQSLPGGAR